MDKYNHLEIETPIETVRVVAAILDMIATSVWDYAHDNEYNGQVVICGGKYEDGSTLPDLNVYYDPHSSDNTERQLYQNRPQSRFIYYVGDAVVDWACNSELCLTSITNTDKLWQRSVSLADPALPAMLLEWHQRLFGTSSKSHKR